MATLPESLRQQIFARAEHRCEYCLTSRRVIGMPLVVDHITPKTLGGTDDLHNLAQPVCCLLSLQRIQRQQDARA